jgi:hypothetical protein
MAPRRHIGPHQLRFPQRHPRVQDGIPAPGPETPPSYRPVVNTVRSQLQIETSRLNSLKSTGPRSEAGQAISSRNYVLKTGIYATSEIIRGENPANLAALADGYYNRFQPSAPEQRALKQLNQVDRALSPGNPQLMPNRR